jgi:hypothetical protein
LAEAEEHVVRAARDLAYLAGELARVSAESERRGDELQAAQDDCRRLNRRLEVLERMVAAIGPQRSTEVDALEARLDGAHAQAAGAIRAAEARASTALREARATLHAVVADRDAAIADAAATARERVQDRDAATARAAAVTREAVADREEAALAAANAESQPTAHERRLVAELEHLRRERIEHENRLRDDLARATTEKLELRTRLSLCEHALAERDRELERERKLADEAMRWASSVERTLVAPDPVLADAPAEDCATTSSVEPPAVLRRRGGRVRLRTAS